MVVYAGTRAVSTLVKHSRQRVSFLTSAHRNYSFSHTAAANNRLVSFGTVNRSFSSLARKDKEFGLLASVRSESTEQNLRDAFVKYDKGDKTYLTREELRMVLEEVSGEKFEKIQIETLYTEFDKYEDGKIDFPELEKLFSFLDFEMKKQINLHKSLDMAVKNSKIESEKLLKSIAKNLFSIKDILCIQDDNVYKEDTVSNLQDTDSSSHSTMMLDFKDILGDDHSVTDLDAQNIMDPDFQSAFSASDMRCLALVSHNGMKKTMREFVVANKNLLKKFRLTGTNSTMTMLREVFKDEAPGTVVFGPTCESGPLGGDAELVGHMVDGKIGGIMFFQDPMDSHPHRVDIDCLCRQALVHNIMIADTPSSALMICHCLRQALMGEGRAELIPSFFFSLQSPTIEAYKTKQKAVIKSHEK